MTTQYFDRSTLFMDRLNAGNVEKLTVNIVESWYSAPTHGGMVRPS